MNRIMITFAVLLLALPAMSNAGEVKPIMPGPRQKCPVCGMFVAKYPDFIAELVFTDGSYAVFDGIKDMMKYYFDLQKYNPGKTVSDISAIFVMDYYRLEFIDGRLAFFVAGSDVYGPMGRELIPFGKRAEAEEFIKDHKGKKLLTFEQIDETLIKSLD